MFAVVVTLTVKPDHLNDFMPLMAENAATSLSAEPGCRQFDVCTDPDHPNIVFLYEIYESEAAFKLHLASAHFQAFDQRTAAMVANKIVQTFREVRQ